MAITTTELPGSGDFRKRFLTTITAATAATDTVVDVSAVLPDGYTKVRLVKVAWSLATANVILRTDHTTDFVMFSAQPGEGCIDFECDGGITDEETGGTGDLVLATGANAAGTVYMVVDFE